LLFSQPWNLAHASNAQVQPSNPATQAPQDVSRSNHNVSTIASQPSAGDVKSIGRSELPAVIMFFLGFLDNNIYKAKLYFHIYIYIYPVV
jgi:hypothetical protein